MKSKTILIIDDQPAHLVATAACLEYAPEAYSILTASNGHLGCEIAAREQPDLIILDWMMPEMNGLEVLQYLKQNPETTDIPVVMLTAVDSAQRLEQAFAIGASDYLRSPIDKSELLARVRSVLALMDSYKQIKEQHHRLEVRNQEIAKQRQQLEQQAIDIRIANAKLQQANKALEVKNAQLIELNYEKNELLGIAAHDLKNPISNIKMLAQVLYNEADTLSAQETREYAKDILADAGRMFDLVMKLLNINAIESGTLRMEPVQFDAAVAVQMVVESYHSRAVAKNIQLVYQSPMVEMPVFADHSASLQVIDNLISNAIKYTPPGKTVNVSIEQQPRSLAPLAEASPSSFSSQHSKHTHRMLQSTAAESRREHPVVVIRVRDEGPGLTEEDKSKLFGKFARLSAQPTGGETSTGLGLSIVKKIVELMNGAVWCESKAGQGATFVVEFPQHPVHLL
jgi:signal transduction histidine kinase